DHRAQSLGVARRVATQYAQHAGIRPAQPLDAFDGRRLARTVGTDQTDDLAGAHVKVARVHNDSFAVGLAEPADGDDQRTCHTAIIPRATRSRIEPRTELVTHPPG